MPSCKERGRTCSGQHSHSTDARATSGAPLKRTSCPQYSVPQAELPGRVLSLSVWHRESLGRNIFLGEVEVPLDTWNWDSEATWLPLQPRVRRPGRVGSPATQISSLYRSPLGSSLGQSPPSA
jgi:synaptotagmin-like protein